MLEGREHAVVRGGDERNGHRLADQVLGLFDAGTVADDESLGISNLVRNQEGANGELVAGRDGKRTGTDKADIDGAAGNGRDHVSSGIELQPLDRASYSLVVDTVRLGDLGGLNDRLVPDSHRVIGSGEADPEHRGGKHGGGKPLAPHGTSPWFVFRAPCLSRQRSIGPLIVVNVYRFYRDLGRMALLERPPAGKGFPQPAGRPAKWSYLMLPSDRPRSSQRCANSASA